MSRRFFLLIHLPLLAMAGILLYLHAAQNPQPTTHSKAYPMQAASYPSTRIPFTATRLEQHPQTVPPVICNVQIVDLNDDAQAEVLIADTQAHAILLGHYQEGVWYEQIVADKLHAPARAEVCDFDQDGDKDLLVAELGDVFPNDKLIGRIIFLRNDSGVFTKIVLAEGLGRVADVRSADFDNNGTMDLAVAVFGHGHGQVLQMLQFEPMQFETRIVLEGPGSIHVPIADFNNDGHPDIACVISQEEEEVWLCLNDGNGTLQKQCIFKSMNPDFGSSGLVLCDIDQDGDSDLLLPHGDNLEEFFHYPQSYHGCLLFVNDGTGIFTTQRISDLPGCYAADCADLDQDGDLDVVLLSMVNDWRQDDSASVVILEHDGQLGFQPRQLAARPIGFITCATGDANNDGNIDIIAGSFRIQPPYDHVSRLHAWFGKAP